MQVANARFDRTQPREWRDIPFAYDDAQTYPTLPEAVFWSACALLVVLLFSMAMGADVFKILRMVL